LNSLEASQGGGETTEQRTSVGVVESIKGQRPNQKKTFYLKIWGHFSLFQEKIHAISFP
jgi:hypothetical protein